MPTYVQNRRSLVKAITFRALIITSDFLVMFLITRRVDMTVGLVIGTNLASSLLYYFHERIWSRIRWGRVV
jgi:adenylylsulfate kinase